MSDSCSTWIFEGDATSVHIEGTGSALLVDERALSDGQVSTVELHDAQLTPYRGIKTWKNVETLHNPESLDPFNGVANVPYDVTYQAGSTIEITVRKGGSDGRYVGSDGMPECASETACKVLWAAPPNILKVVRAKTTDVELTGEFPFGEHSGPQVHVDALQLHVVRGALTCGEHRVHIKDRDVRFSTVLHVKPLVVHGVETFNVTAEVASPPDELVGTHHGPLLAVVGGALVVMIAALAFVWWRQRTRSTNVAAIGNRPAWFETVPLDFGRSETREALRILTAAYPKKTRALALAEDSGLDLTAIDQDGDVKTVLREIVKAAAASGHLLGLLAEVLQDDAVAAYAQQLRSLLDGQEAKIAAAVLANRPTVSRLAAVPPHEEVWMAGQKPTALGGALERIINAAAGFADVESFRRGLTSAEYRTARIIAGGHPIGTGFLVGNSLLLTAHHVVANADAPLSAQFDHLQSADGDVAMEGRRVGFAEDWKLALSPNANVQDELGPTGPKAGSWDYALVRLAESVGEQSLGPQNGDGAEPRGILKLDGDPYTFLVGEPVIIVGHPTARPMQLSYAAPSHASLTALGTRVRYATNTEPGSSGSPVFNRDWRVIALHHGSGPTKQPGLLDVADGTFNQGIPISKIVHDLKLQLRDRPQLLAELGLKPDP